MTEAFLNWDEVRFLTNYRCLNEMQQAIVGWQLKNIDLLRRLIPVEYLSRQELQDIQSAALERGDELMTVLVSCALFRKESAGQTGEGGL